MTTFKYPKNLNSDFLISPYLWHKITEVRLALCPCLPGFHSAYFRLLQESKGGDGDQATVASGVS
jgi:hypothetical protein